MTPTVFKFPVVRAKGYLRDARFEGTDERLLFFVDYPDIAGNLATIGFRLYTAGEDAQEMCVPVAAYDLNTLSRDTLIAHLRMASMISGTIPSSIEWEDALKQEAPGQARYFQTAMGQVKVATFSTPDDASLDIEFQRGSTSDKVTHNVSINEVAHESYIYAPQTQLLVIPGSVLKQFPSGYKHDYPNGDILTAQERQDIIDYVNNLELWI